MNAVCFTYRSDRGVYRVLRDVSLGVGAGRLQAVIGRSGVGKSTLLRIISGELQPDQGEIRRALPAPGRLATLYHPQEAMLLPWESVEQNALLGLRFTGARPTEDPTSLLNKFGLGDHLAHHPATLSGGQIERTALARTLLTPAEVYLLDEPLSGTDYPLRLQLETFLVHFLAERSCAGVVVTHDIPQAVAIGHEILLLTRDPSGALAQPVAIPVTLAALDPVARRAHPDFGGFVQHLVEQMGAGEQLTGVDAQPVGANTQ